MNLGFFQFWMYKNFSTIDLIVGLKVDDEFEAGIIKGFNVWGEVDWTGASSDEVGVFDDNVEQDVDNVEDK